MRWLRHIPPCLAIDSGMMGMFVDDDRTGEDERRRHYLSLPCLSRRKELFNRAVGSFPTVFNVYMIDLFNDGYFILPDVHARVSECRRLCDSIPGLVDNLRLEYFIPVGLNRAARLRARLSARTLLLAPLVTCHPHLGQSRSMVPIYHLPTSSYRNCFQNVNHLLASPLSSDRIPNMNVYVPRSRTMV